MSQDTKSRTRAFLLKLYGHDDVTEMTQHFLIGPRETRVCKKLCVWDDFFCEKIIPYTQFFTHSVLLPGGVLPAVEN
jgi:hypothetical protein